MKEKWGDGGGGGVGKVELLNNGCVRTRSL